MNKTIWTVGHSTLAIDEFIALMQAYGIELVVDVRTVPRSRKNPQFNQDQLEQVLPDAGIAYLHEKELGGLRRANKDSSNMGWRNESFRGFADYMQTPAFWQALGRLTAQALEQRTVIMCAEVLPWRCHRSLIADALLVIGFAAVEILSLTQSRQHELTSFAVVEAGKVTYPASGKIDDAQQ